MQLRIKIKYYYNGILDIYFGIYKKNANIIVTIHKLFANSQI